jgi:hypothetical protein
MTLQVVARAFDAFPTTKEGSQGSGLGRFTHLVLSVGMNGRELADATQALRPGLPALFTSGCTENAIVHNARVDPDVHLLCEPYQRRELAAKRISCGMATARDTGAWTPRCSPPDANAARHLPSGQNRSSGTQAPAPVLQQAHVPRFTRLSAATRPQRAACKHDHNHDDSRADEPEQRGEPDREPSGDSPGEQCRETERRCAMQQYRNDHVLSPGCADQVRC